MDVQPESLVQKKPQNIFKLVVHFLCYVLVISFVIYSNIPAAWTATRTTLLIPQISKEVGKYQNGGIFGLIITFLGIFAMWFLALLIVEILALFILYKKGKTPRSLALIFGVAAFVIILTSYGAQILFRKPQPLSIDKASKLTTPVPLPSRVIKETTSYTPSLNDASVANWKTYTNNASTFMIKFPDNWHFDDSQSSQEADRKYYGALSQQISQYPQGQFSTYPLEMSSAGKWTDTTSEEEFYDPNNYRTGIYGGGIARMHEKPAQIQLGALRFMKQKISSSPDEPDNYEGEKVNHHTVELDYTALVNNLIFQATLYYQDNDPAHEVQVKEFEKILSTIDLH